MALPLLTKAQALIQVLVEAAIHLLEQRVALVEREVSVLISILRISSGRLAEVRGGAGGHEINLSRRRF